MRAAKKLEAMEQLFLQQIKIAQRTRELKTRENPAILARYLLTMWNGLNITRRLYPDPEALLSLIKLQLATLK